MIGNWSVASWIVKTFSGQSLTVAPRRCGWWKPIP
jgi:hypothetical protein